MGFSEARGGLAKGADEQKSYLGRWVHVRGYGHGGRRRTRGSASGAMRTGCAVRGVAADHGRCTPHCGCALTMPPRRAGGWPLVAAARSG